RDSQSMRAIRSGLQTATGPLAAARMPTTVVHGDYWCGNLLVHRGRVSGVVDWEAGEPAGEPLRDVVRSVLAYALYLDRHTRPGRPVAGHPGLRAGRFGAGVLAALAGRGWVARPARPFVEAAVARPGGA